MALGPARVALLVGTRKGAFILHGDLPRKQWRLDGPHFLGAIIHHMILDPRDRHTVLATSSTGHLGPTVFRTTDWGQSWTEATTPPAFPKLPEPEEGRAVSHAFWLTPGHASQPGVWWAGTSPPGLFRSEDAGATWEPIAGFNDDLWQMVKESVGPVPGGAITHSILVDPTDPAHIHVSISSGGTFESKDGGRSFNALNKGVAADFIPTPDPVFGHDPHCVVQHPMRPTRLYQQNHCGIYRLDRPSDTWVRIGKKMPTDVGDIGFPIVIHPRDPDTAWVIPMDGTTVWPRTSVGGRPAVFRTSDAGNSWQRQDAGLPQRDAWLTIKRQAFGADTCDPVGLYFGTTSGEIWVSDNEGASWRTIARHLPEIYSLVAGMVES